ncbi:MAG: peptide-methionine (R)-S-oxide reductase [Armatimonadota bacterium]
MKPMLFVLPTLLIGSAVFLSAARGQEVKVDGMATSSPKRADKVVLSDAAWKKRLTKEQYAILRDKGTEPAFCGVNLGQHGAGVYKCVGCGLELFRASEKFTSGTGWPSFFRPIAPDRVWIKTDTAYGMQRTEVLCARCDGHLGHVFNDGPKPTGLRYCMNGKVMKFFPDAATKPLVKRKN